ncbi:hypothetical protein VTJ83DRAFT_4970 [Remersonia thermophila]|uniref:DUF676 domain-containing protein n=1 Tax=Remersonia thermophila TaxID=72144 RepID=A0ABR4DBJ2_9PEZI
MLLLHQTGSVKIGEVVRYTVTYKPSADHILPSPEFLYLRIKNTCAAALRAAFVHGPYTLSVAAYPSHFKPFEKFDNPRRYGVPEFEPMLKAGGTWNCHLIVPDNIRQTAGEGISTGHFGSGPEHDDDTVSWVIEIASQVIFSASAHVHYELLLARDEKSLNLGSVVPIIGGQAQVPRPGRVSDFQQGPGGRTHHPAQPKGVFSKAVHLKVEDTAALWNTPRLPGWDDVGWLRAREADLANAAPAGAPPPGDGGTGAEQTPRPRFKQKKVHLVVLTHGLHSNLGADMLFLKESIDAAVKQAKTDAKARKARERAARPSSQRPAASDGAPTTELVTPATGPETETNSDNAGDQPNGVPPQHLGEQEKEEEEEEQEEEDEDDEEVIVRGFSGNATRTERGIKYLGKRLARYILSMTYPDQPCLPTAKAASEAIAHTLKATSHRKAGDEAHKHGAAAHAAASLGGKRLYKFTKISFIAHSLGGLVQTYAVAYIQKHSPHFFDLIEPVNFIALASPFLGLNHENPLYVKFALDFGLVGRTGQDLGLTWRAPTIARNGWGALVGGLGDSAHKRVHGEPRPESKPLLRILPTGPAHKALRKFRNRTVYSNVVNDGIVPLRTSCLLFLDWQGLGRVEKARREAGLVETVVGFGWAELTGANVTSPRLAPWSEEESHEKNEADATSRSTPARPGHAQEVPQPPTNAVFEDDRQSLRSMTGVLRPPGDMANTTATTTNPFAGLLNFFRGEGPKPPPPTSPKVPKIYQRSQTLKPGDWTGSADPVASSKSRVTSGHELADEPEGVLAPPKTSVFEAAGDLLNPKLPSIEFLIDPSKRPRTIFHDRVYHPTDIPPPPVKQKTTTSTLNLLRWNPAAASSSPKAGSGSVSPSPSAQQLDHKDSTPAPQASRPRKESTVSTDNDSTVHSPSLASADSVAAVAAAAAAAAAVAPAGPEQPLQQRDGDETPTPEYDISHMRVEEKIARAYHRGLSWRKVLVKLEPDAHNNIVVRRMFANAFGWPVVQHLVEAHFSDAAMARTRDEDVPGLERAKDPAVKTGADGKETKPEGEVLAGEAPAGGAQGGGNEDPAHEGESDDTVSDLPSADALGVMSPPVHASSPGAAPPCTAATPSRPPLDRIDSVTWSDRDWVDSADESDDPGSGKTRTAAAAAAAKKKAAAEPQPAAPASVEGKGKAVQGEGGGATSGLGLSLAGSGGGGGGSSSSSSSSSSEKNSSANMWSWTEKFVRRARSKSPTGTAAGGSGGTDPGVANK